MNKIRNYIKTFALTALVAGAFVGLSGHVSARTQYNDNGNATSKTPVFNEFYDVPGVGDEADFVRVKPQAGGNDAYVNSLNTACKTGDEFTVRTYVHDGASPDYNNNGSGSAVAHNVYVAMTAPLNQTKSNFTFSSKVTSSNAASDTDSASLGCGGDYKLTLVPSTVKTYSKSLGYNTERDSAVNGVLKIGSRAHGSGDVWGCWDDRVIVVYTVKVTKKVVPPKSLGECKVVEVATFDNRRVKVVVKGTVDNAEIVDYKINFGDGTISHKQTDTHKYAEDGTYRIVTSVKIKFADGHTEWKTATDCQKKVTFETNVPPKVTPPTPTPKTLVNTGAGDIAGIFTGTSLMGAFLHRKWTLRKQK